MSSNTATATEEAKKSIDVLDLVNDKTVSLYSGLGFVTLVDAMPRIVPAGRTADIAIADGARVSFGESAKTAEEDRRLINYLMEHYHTSPFEQVSFKFKIRCPIFVERQLIRHRCAKLNQASYRYSQPKEEFYFPKLRMQCDVNRQASSAAEVPAELAEMWRLAEENAKSLFSAYRTLVDKGVAREVARCCLPVALMTEMVWKMDLHNLLNFLRLRMDSHAQQEIQELANAIYSLVLPIVPDTIGAFRRHRIEVLHFSELEQQYSKDPTAVKLTARQKIDVDKKLKQLSIENHKSKDE